MFSFSCSCIVLLVFAIVCVRAQMRQGMYNIHIFFLEVDYHRGNLHFLGSKPWSAVSYSTMSPINLPLDCDTCTVHETDSLRVCTHIAKCVSVLEAALKGVIPQTCFLEANVPIVCCPSTSSAFPSTDQKTCPPLPAGAVNAQITGYKSRDYCISLAESIPCPAAGDGWTKGNICPSVRLTSNTQDGNMTDTEFPHVVKMAEILSHSECSAKYPTDTEFFPDGIRFATQMCASQRTNSMCLGSDGSAFQVYNGDRVSCSFLLVGLRYLRIACDVYSITRVALPPEDYNFRYQ